MDIQLRGDRFFRWRGGDVSRIEAFSDAVFAFSITLLVVSLDVPSSFQELMAAMKGFFAFGLCFALLIYIWYNHYIFFRRYGLEDPWTVTLNGFLLFVVLFYIYPLKFLWTFLSGNVVEPSHEMVASQTETGQLMIVYSLGFLLVFVLLGVLHLHAYRKRAFLQLDTLELHELRSSVQLNFLQAAFGIVSVSFILIGFHPAAAGLIYCGIGPAAGVHGYVRARSAEKLFEELKKTGDEGDLRLSQFAAK